MQTLTRHFVAALAGAMLAWVMTAFVLHAMFAAGGYTREALVELPPWGFGTIGAAGALGALALIWTFGSSPLPTWVRPAILGGLVGIAAVVAVTLGAARSLGGQSAKGQAPYLHVGLVYGVPIGLVSGVLVGLQRRWRPSAELCDATEPPTTSLGDGKSSPAAR